MKLLRKIIRFFLHPKYQQYRYSKKMGRKLFWNTLGLKLLLGFGAGILMTGAIQILGMDPGEHAFDKMLEEYPAWVLFALGVFFAPLFEELVFRAPLGVFRTSRYFSWAFYISVVTFGLVHLFNFEAFDSFFWLAPILVLPQLIAGVFLAFIRVRMGLLYSILMHAAYNSVVLSPFLAIAFLKPLFN